ncbi:MAG: hypothetical protein KAU24_01390 [Candidatus Aenigmarchaeota archaeon]|nr:hypothetical protein [Candidatus Aenigmarchaeota archaeon]
MRLLKGFISMGLKMKNGIKNGTETFKLAMETDSEKLKKKLIGLGISLDKIECIGCKEKLEIDKIRGIYGYDNTVFFFCRKTKCQIEAYHKLLDL